MVDSRDKGKRGEYQIRDKLRTKTGLEWERVPGSGAFGANHSLKGDIYLPPGTGAMSLYCFEIKWFADEHINSNILNIGESQFEKWWTQCAREGVQMNMQPALVFKKDRGDWMVALDAMDTNTSILLDYPHFIIHKKDMEVVVGKFEPWLHNIKKEKLYK